MVQRASIDEFSSSKYLQTCEITADEKKVDPFTMVIFGGTGDLSRKKLLPALFHNYAQGEFPGAFSILGVGSSSHTDDEFRDLAREGVQTSDPSVSGEKWQEFRSHLFYFSGDLKAEESYGRLCARLEEIGAPAAGRRKDLVYYMALPPEMSPGVVKMLDKHGLCRGAVNTKIIVEKPFGNDVVSARQLNRELTASLDERQIYRIDHYLGKETVQNIIYFRFSNGIFEQLWSHLYIDNVQITVAEDIGVENRARYYDQAGVIRDIVQNHILQIIGMVAMEPPVGFEADFIRDEKTKVFRSIHPVTGDDIDRFTVVGQYGPGTVGGKEVPGYREEKGIAPDSRTATFFAGTFYIANWRWAGVPFYVRTGKRMAARVTEIAIQFDQPPLRLFDRSCGALDPDVLLLRIQPNESISLRFGVKVPGKINQIYPIDMRFCYEDTFPGPQPMAYERLLLDCLKGDLTLFVRQDQIEAMWGVVDPIIAKWESRPRGDFPNYAAGSWGPEEAKKLLERDGRRWITS